MLSAECFFTGDVTEAVILVRDKFCNAFHPGPVQASAESLRFTAGVKVERR